MKRKLSQYKYSGNSIQWGHKQFPFSNEPKTSYLVASTSTYLTKSQLEAGRKVVSRITKRYKPRPHSQVLPVFLTPLTSKSSGSRMGKGKGSISKYVCRLNGNSILFKFQKIQKPVLIHLFRKVSLKLPTKLKYVFNSISPK